MARIVFDLDGTLIDSLEDIRAVAGEVLAAEGARPLSREETRRFVGEGTVKLIERMIAARELDPARLDPMHDALLARYETAVDLTVTYPGVPGALAALRRAGHRLAVCTNKPAAPARAVLAHLGLDAGFDEILGGDEVARRKPDPLPLTTVLNRMGRGMALYVGDSETDAATAAGAGVPFLLFTEGYPKGDVAAIQSAGRFGDFGDLPELVERMLGC